MDETPYARFCRTLRAYFDAHTSGDEMPVAVIAVTPVEEGAGADGTITVPVTASVLAGLDAALSLRRVGT
jgi:hypothetical protein